MTCRPFIIFAFALFSLLACGPDQSSGAIDGGSGGATMAPPSSSGMGGAMVAQDPECAARPDGAPCKPGALPSHQCDENRCVVRVPPACFGWTSDDAGACPSCDDGNPCTEDACVAGACSHAFLGAGASCSPGGVMQCWAGACCPVGGGERVCTAEGERAECAVGSVCLAGRCWISCDPPFEGACGGELQFPACEPYSVGGVTRSICQ